MNIHEQYGLRRVVNACGKMTHLAGAAVLPEVIAAATAAMPCFFELNELQARAGEVIARATGAEAGCVTACAAAGITLGVAACMTGEDLGKIAQLPDTTGMKNEVVLQKGHSVNFGAPVEQMIRLAGASVREIGTVNHTAPFHLEAALTEATAAAVFVVSHHTVQYGFIPLPEFVRRCHARGVPVVVDGAAEDLILRDLIAAGADLVTCSGHKFLCGTTAGLVCGRQDLIRAVYAQNRGIGRGMKVGKEGIVGLMAALEYRMSQDLPAWTREQDRKVERILALLEGAPSLRLSVEPDPTGCPFSRVRVDVHPNSGRSARSICLAMEEGDPTIKLRAHHVDEGYFLIDAVDLNDEEIDLLCRRLREVITRAG